MLIAAMKNAASFVNDPKLKKVLRDNAGLEHRGDACGSTRNPLQTTLSGEKGTSTQRRWPGADCGPAGNADEPGMTALWEQALDDISQGKMSLAVFMQKQLQWTRHLVEKGRPGRCENHRSRHASLPVM